MRFRTRYAVGLACLFLFLAVGRSRAQNITGTITGVVTDPSGAVVPGVQVTATNQGTALKRTTKTDSKGYYVFTFLPVGVYTISTEGAGFKNSVVSGITLQVDQTARIDVKLEVGAVSQKVTVSGEAPLTNTQTSQVGEVVENQRIVDLPLNGRQFLQLTQLNSGGSETSGSFDSALQLSGPRIIMNGQMEQYNNFTIDGTDATDSFYHTLSFSPSVDAIQEFKILTNNYSAEFGTSTGAQVNVSIKSGTNAFHGDAYEFVRNSIFDAKNFFDNPLATIPPYRQNQFGFTLGGPIRKNKTFFFGNYEGLRIRQAITTVQLVPDPDMRNGNLNGLIALGQPVPINRATHMPFPNNTIDPSTFSPAAKEVLAQLPLPTSGITYIAAPSQANDDNQFNIRIDQNISRRNSLFGRFSYDNASLLTPGLIPAYDGTTTSYTRNLAVGDTQIINSRTVNEFRFGFNRTTGGEGLPNPLPNFNSSIGLQGATTDPRFVGMPQFSISAFGTYGPPNLRINRIDNEFQFADNLTYTKGRHDLKFGAFFERYQFNPFSDAFGRGALTFNGSDTGNSYADFLLGVPFLGFVATGDVTLHGRSYLTGGYAEDNWHVASNFVLNLGLRYQYLAPVTDTNGLISTIDLNYSGGPVFVATNTDPSHFAPGFPAALPLPLISAKQAGLPTSLVKPDKTDFAPRIGFAWTPLGNQKTVLRAAYGIFYANPSFNWPAQEKFNSPWLDLRAILNFGNAFNALNIFTAPPLGNSSAFPVDPNFRIGYTNQWSLGIEQQLSPNTMFSVTYIGNNGVHLMRITTPNQPEAGPGRVGPRRPIPQLGNFSFNQSRGVSSYNALQARIEKRPSRGLNFVGEYSYSRCLDQQSTLNGSLNDQGNPQNTHDLAADKGLCSFDHHHRFVGSVVYNLPFGPGGAFLNKSSGFVGKVVGGWYVTSIVTVQDGLPFGIQDGVDRSNTGAGTDRPNVVPGVDPNLPKSQRSTSKYFNTAAFVLQPLYTFGDAGRNILRGPSLTDVDFSVFKNTYITERQAIEFRAEFFNLFNHPNFNTPNRVRTSALFGHILSAQPPRLIQFGLKYVF